MYRRVETDPSGYPLDVVGYSENYICLTTVSEDKVRIKWQTVLPAGYDMVLADDICVETSGAQIHFLDGKELFIDWQDVCRYCYDILRGGISR